MTDLPSSDLEILIAHCAHEDVVSLVEATTFGSGALRYRRLAVSEQLRRFIQPIYFHAVYRQRLVGVYVLDKRRMQLAGRCIDAYYRGVLAVEGRYQGLGIGKRLTAAARQWISAQTEEQTVLSYGCIDKSNHRSIGLLKSNGAHVMASLSMYMMYRQWPSLRCHLEPLDDPVLSQVATLADELYADCVLRDLSPGSVPGVVLNDAQGVAISARVSTSAFAITNMGPVATWGTRLLVKPFAAARRRFNPDHFRYVSFSDVLIRAGCEKQWPAFVSSVLARYHCHFGIVYIDPRSQVFASLQRSSLASRLTHNAQGSISVVVQAFNLPDRDVELLHDQQSIVQLWPIDA